MVVDDEPDIVTMVKRGLESRGFVVEGFTNPTDALAKFKRGDYEMLITDIRMPVMTGFELYREIRKIDDKIKIVLMTAFEINVCEFRKMFASIDVKYFVRKPVSTDRLESPR
jgi:CheY-like chemotaxis protein